MVGFGCAARIAVWCEVWCACQLPTAWSMFLESNFGSGFGERREGQTPGEEDGRTTKAGQAGTGGGGRGLGVFGVSGEELQSNPLREREQKANKHTGSQPHPHPQDTARLTLAPVAGLDDLGLGGGVHRGVDLGRLEGLLLVLLPGGGDLGIQRIVGVGLLQEQLDAQHDLGDEQGGGPLGLEDVQADAADAVHVGVLREAGTGRGEWRCGRFGQRRWAR